MFGGTDLTEVANIANEDVVGFFEYSFSSKFDRDKYNELLKELNRIDNLAYSKCNVFSTPVASFVEQLLVWVEKQWKQKRAPWAEMDDGKLELRSDEIKDFLEKIEDWLDCFLDPPRFPCLRRGVPDLRQKPRSFGEYVARHKVPYNPWIIEWVELLPEHKILPQVKGFTSWVMVKKNTKSIFVKYDKEKILKYYKKSPLLAYFVYACLFLHELGHVRRKETLDIYLNSGKEEHVPSHPLHECEAWLYMRSVYMILSSCRSRLSRLTKNKDSEWEIDYC